MVINNQSNNALLVCFLSALYLAMVVSSFAPAVTIPMRPLSSKTSTAVFQSTIATTPTAAASAATATTTNDRNVQRRDMTSIKNNVYAPPSTASVSSSQVVSTQQQQQQQQEEYLAELRSMSLKELKLACSRRNIRYYKFASPEDYVQALWKCHQKALEFSVTGVVQPGMVADVTGEQLDAEMTGRTDSVIVVDVYATWCGPCKLLVPHLESAARQLGDQARVLKLDSEKNASWAGRYQVQGLPTLLLIKNGRIVDRMEGAHGADAILGFVQTHI
eukprot:CAMPEP_0178851698 /NCGR_PEP_ID=MMETSP0746-20121128/21270_1 /TAXON_ID=913974 /ORGANISM="Nitzschia punctata, Strain CCMP561" /LENGTH=274 /DNA_ID=CAMNT_0020517299 /DNA_START=142 /DNA_END=966 /DNA_ORIENTATION=-